MKLSFCITCMNRLYQLRETLLHNLKAIESFEHVQLCLVNFNSQDGLHDYIRENFLSAIKAGKLKYFYTMQPQYFHCSKAKNLAHRLGDGEILYNLDGDNFISPQNVENIIDAFNQHKNIFLHECIRHLPIHNGTYGRIALTQRDFYDLGGYDEKLLGVAQHDRDLIKRLQKSGRRVINLPHVIQPAIFNDKLTTVANQRFKIPYLVYNQMNFVLVKWRRFVKYPVNPNGMNKFNGELNFRENLKL